MVVPVPGRGAVAEALFDRATDWACEHNLVSLFGTFNLDREESRGILVEGRDRPPVSYCAHNPPYYVGVPVPAW
ncbi:MAG: hypothetical protein NTW99_01725 [Chloroflexi bacterium]|nr:hypothetical protein [Chloroflexota bacterium]